MNNQTVNVHNGTLKLGSFEGTKLDVNGTELEVAATSASLTNTDIILQDGASLLVAANATMSNNSHIYFEGGAELRMESGASLSLDDSSKLEAGGYIISKPNEGQPASRSAVNEEAASCISGNNAILTADKIENATLSNLAINAIDAIELKNTTLSNGARVVAADNTISLNQVTLTAGSKLDDILATSAASGLTITGTLEAAELKITSLTFDLATLGAESKREGQHTVLTSTDTPLSLDEEVLTGSNTNFDYSFTLNEAGELVVNSTLTNIVVSGVSYDEASGWTLSVSADQYELLELNSNSFSGNFLFSAEALAEFELAKEANAELEWMESYTVSYGNVDDTLSINDLTNSADITLNGAAYTENGYGLATIPEPSTVTLSLLALAGLAARRRRKVA